MSKASLSRLQLEKEFLIYLDGENILRELQQAAFDYKKSVNGSIGKKNFIPPFKFQITLDLIKIQEISEKLHQLFMKEPEAGRTLAKNIISVALKFLTSTVDLEKSDLQIVFVVVNLPITREISDLLLYPSYGLESVQGVLIAKTSIVKYVRSIVCTCRVPFCPGNKWQRYPGKFEKICPDCFSYMDEDVSSSDMGEEVLCQFTCIKAYQSLGRFQALNVKIKDKLCSSIDLEIGEEYGVIGRLTENFFEAMNIQAKQTNTEYFFKLINSSTLPDSVTALFFQVSADCPNCPWSFVSALASLLASDLIPPSSFLHLKTGLLLSLSSQKNEEAPVPLVAVGPDSLNAQYLFHAVGKLAERYVRQSIAHSYLGGAAKAGLQSDVIWQEAGQLILAAKGVCNLGDWSKFKKEQANYICQTLESGQIVMNKGEVGKTNLINFATLKCSVWTYWCHITTSRNDQLQLKTLINVFGMPFLAEEKNEVEISKICLKHLEKSMKHGENTPEPEAIPAKDFQEFLKIINSRELVLSEQASQLIRNYFVVSRSERPQCLPLGAIKTITSLAEAHARLALRDEVLYEDVIAVIYLYEEAISALFGESIAPYSKLIWDHREPLYVFMGKQLHLFRIWLEEYISMR